MIPAKSNRLFILSVFVIVGSVLVGGIAQAQSPARAASDASAKKPNIVIILIDDLGWTDLHCFGSTFYQTPNIDRLASEGMKFTQADSACCVCSPSRAELMTGETTARLHITNIIPGAEYPWAKLREPEWCENLPLSEPNLAKTLKTAGYTTACIGKWHLGRDARFWPLHQGFDVNIAGCGAGSPSLNEGYFSPYHIPTLKDGPPGEYLTDRLTDEAVHFITDNQSKPFFLYLAHYAVHVPLEGKPDLVAKYRALADPNNPQHNPIYAAMIESVDDSVGRVMATLDKLNLARNTLIIFTSDNGGYMHSTSNLPLRAGKGFPYEGGTRVPLIIKWPGATPPGSVCDVPVIGYDFYPTILGITGTRDVAGHILDGVSLVPLLKQTGGLPRDTLYWHFPHYCYVSEGGARPYSAIRKGDYRLVQFFEDDHVELYDLKTDIGEKIDLAIQMPEKANELVANLEAWRKAVGAQMPTPNPQYDPAKAGVVLKPEKHHHDHKKAAPTAPAAPPQGEGDNRDSPSME